ncbi:predicted protein [Uncinocarpus reesii 1704]|uniref:Uncharacterized protein n=1 Tax=Uncinocarpus reesii (strain UAMH 1704) TaxID=336963 RepID=C4JMX4_UNCRE|nr:uncharacterized protein UREG_04182 [Uncinocarpus reesii 1704]EEP79336.1 predicted protein [Uncinocarpus reesii 1704]
MVIFRTPESKKRESERPTTAVRTTPSSPRGDCCHRIGRHDFDFITSTYNLGLGGNISNLLATMLVYHGLISNGSATGIQSVLAILPARTETGSRCVILWHSGSHTPSGPEVDTNPGGFGRFDTILDEVENDGDDIVFRSGEPYSLKMRFSEDQEKLDLSFQPMVRQKTTACLSMGLVLRCPPSHNSWVEYAPAIFWGPIMTKDEYHGRIIVFVLCLKDENGSSSPVAAFITWNAETAMFATSAEDFIKEESRFTLSNQRYLFRGEVEYHEHASPQLLLQLASSAPGPDQWVTTQSLPALDNHCALIAGLGSSNWSDTVQVTNDTWEFVVCTIEKSDPNNEAYTKGMAAGGLFLAVLGVLACAAPPAAGMVVGIAGLLLAGQSAYDTFSEQTGQATSRVLYSSDQATRSRKGSDDSDIIIFRVHMKENQLKITRYVVPKVKENWYFISDIFDNKLKNETPQVKDWFTFPFEEPHTLVSRRYLTIPNMRPTADQGSPTPPKKVPDSGAGIHYNYEGGFERYYAVDEKHPKLNLFKNFERHPGYTAIVQGDSEELNSRMTVRHMQNSAQSPILEMKHWKPVNYRKYKIGMAETGINYDVLKLIHADYQKSYTAGYLWDCTEAGAYGAVYRLSFQAGPNVRSRLSTHIFMGICFKLVILEHNSIMIKRKLELASLEPAIRQPRCCHVGLAYCAEWLLLWTLYTLKTVITSSMEVKQTLKPQETRVKGPTVTIEKQLRNDYKLHASTIMSPWTKKIFLALFYHLIDQGINTPYAVGKFASFSQAPTPGSSV